METEGERPIPKPRRTILESKKLNYENVTIDTENKELPTDNTETHVIFKSSNIDSKSTKTVEDEKPMPPIPTPRIARRVVMNEAYENVRNANTSGDIDDDKCISYKSLNIPQKSKDDTDVQNSGSPISACSSENWGGYGLKKSASNSTIDSSMSSVSSSDNQKYKSPPPSQLLKNLGTTSKLLTEAITERVTTRAKSAKHKLNENIKMSQDFLHTLSTDTASRIKSVRKKLNSPITRNDFSLPRYENNSKQPQQQQQQPVIHDQVFKSISFHSPLDRNSNPECSSYSNTYEIPKSTMKKVNYVNEDDACPTFEEAMRNHSYSLKSFGVSSETVSKPPVATYRPIDESDNASDRKSISPPMPNYPAPILKEENLQEDHIYGKVREIQPPIRLKRKQRIDRAAASSSLSAPSNRATVDSLEFSAMSLESLPRDSKEMKNDRMSNTSQSQSWTYYDKEEDEAASSPEPIYANEEATYDRLCEMKTNDSDIILSPKSEKNRGDAQSSKFNERDILYEFDPLRKKNVNDFCVNKSNELLLLEHLLLQETYGTVEDDEGHSIVSSEEDNNSAVSAAACAISPSTSRNDQQISETQNDNDMETVIQSCLAKTDDTNLLDSVTQSKTSWFVNCDNIEKSSQIYNPLNKNNPEITKKVSKTIALPPIKCGEEPPTYAEAIASSNHSINENFIFTGIDQQQTTTEQSKLKMKSVFSNVINKMDVLKRKTSFRTNRSKDVKIVLEMIPRPTISNHLVRHEGALIRFPSGVVEDILNDMQNRKAILRDKKFQTYQDQAMKNLKESFPLENITTIQCVSNNKITDNFTHLYCFEITIAIQKNQSAQQVLSNPNVLVTSKDSGNNKLQRVCHLYGVGKESERDIWMQKLIESLTTVFPNNYTCQYYRVGWCYLKRSITSPWSGTWILLKKRKRKLLFYSEHEMNLEKVDLRKARCIVLKDNDSTTKNLHVEPGPILMVDCPPYTLYIIMSFARETKIWKHIIREVSHNNGPSLNEQQITKYNVPVIVDKCINFVYIYGSMSEGIYRKSGSENSIQKLISLFRVNAFSVEITRPEYSEHDVANVLKRFMRDLPQKLLSRYSESFCSITQMKTRAEKISAYKELLNRLSVIEYQTLKKLIGHLSFIASLNSKNKMSIENLAMIWGPTILQNKDEQMSYSQKEADVMSELIILYKDLFVLTSDEIKKEQEMLMCLQKYYASGESLSNSVKKSGDLKVWITYNKEEKSQTNVSLTPIKTAYEVCKELSAKIKIPPYKLTLFEVILNENLERPLHHDEKVFDVVLRWSNWPEADRKNNYLVVRKNDILKEIERALRNLPTVTPGKELKFADNKTKSLKLLNVELRDTIILIQKKEKNLVHIVKEISLRNTIAYLGCEKKREVPQHCWTITFVEQTDHNLASKNKDSPFVGHVIVGNEWKDRIIWFSSIWHCLYGESVLPQAELVMK